MCLFAMSGPGNRHVSISRHWGQTRAGVVGEHIEVLHPEFQDCYGGYVKGRERHQDETTGDCYFFEKKDMMLP